MSDFEKLLAELAAAEGEQAVLAKSMTATTDVADQNIAAAAAAPGNGEPNANLNPEDNQEDQLAKSLEAAAAAAGVTMIDGEELTKSLDSLNGRVSAAEGILAKGLESAIALIRGQGELLKSMQANIHQLSGQGRGRQTVVTVNERQPVGEQLAKSQAGQVTVGEVLAKANAAFDAKKITGLELTALDVSLRTGQSPSEAVLAKILS